MSVGSRDAVDGPPASWRWLRRAVSVLCAVVGLGSGHAAAAELEARTSQAYDAYLEQARKAFLLHAHDIGTSVRDGIVSAGPASGDGILNVPGGLVHHWIATAFISGVTLEDVMETSRAYQTYREIYSSVVESDIVAQEGNIYRVRLRLRERELGVSAVLDVRSTIEYVGPNSRTAYAISNADEIRQVANAGSRDERLMPAGRDSGFLWRANTFTHFIEHDSGVYVELETLGLSRRFPPLLGWIIEPIARRLGRKSVETSLQEFLSGIRARRFSGKPAPAP